MLYFCTLVNVLEQRNITQNPKEKATFSVLLCIKLFDKEMVYK